MNRMTFITWVEHYIILMVVGKIKSPQSKVYDFRIAFIKYLIIRLNGFYFMFMY